MMPNRAIHIVYNSGPMIAADDLRKGQPTFLLLPSLTLTQAPGNHPALSGGTADRDARAGEEARLVWVFGAMVPAALAP